MAIIIINGNNPRFFEILFTSISTANLNTIINTRIVYILLIPPTFSNQNYLTYKSLCRIRFFDRWPRGLVIGSYVGKIKKQHLLYLR